VIIVGQGRLLRDMPMSDFIAESASPVVRVRCSDTTRLAGLLERSASAVRMPSDGVLEIEGLSSDDIGRAAAQAQLVLFELAPQGASLEEAYMALTAASRDFRSPEIDPSEAAAELPVSA
jgi:ABC-2 type transport system ATP-binding protein